MNKIEFKNASNKLKVSGKPIKGAVLLDVIKINVKKISKPLVNFDTDFTKNELGKKGNYLILIFQKTEEHLFTEIIKCNDFKEKHFRSKIGTAFDTVIGGVDNAAK